MGKFTHSYPPRKRQVRPDFLSDDLNVRSTTCVRQVQPPICASGTVLERSALARYTS
jgi:hypothetical protein